MYCDTIQEIGKKYDLRSVLFIAPSPGESYDFGMTQKEKEQCMRILYSPDQLSICYGGYQPFLQLGERDFVKVIPELSVATLAKDRLPAYFQGTYQELCAQHPDFMKTTGKVENNSVVKSLHSHRINHFIAGPTLSTDDGVEMSATRVRKSLVEREKSELQALLDPRLYERLVSEENLEKIQYRYGLNQEKSQQLASNIALQQQVKEELVQKKHVNPLTGDPMPMGKDKQKSVNKTFLNKKEHTEADRKVISTYLDEVEGVYRDQRGVLLEEKKKVESVYKARIYSPEVQLQLSS